MAKQTKEQQAAADGANLVIDHLAHTGTGKEKLDIAREVLSDLGNASSKEDGANLVVAHLRRRGVTEATVNKAQAFIDGGMKQPPPDAASVFVPGSTTPGTVTQASANAPKVIPQAQAALTPTNNPPQPGDGRK